MLDVTSIGRRRTSTLGQKPKTKWTRSKSGSINGVESTSVSALSYIRVDVESMTKTKT